MGVGIIEVCSDMVSLLIMVADLHLKISILGLKRASNGREGCENIGMYTEHDTILEKRRLQHYVGKNVPTSFCNHSLYMEKADCWDPNCLCDECHPEIDGLGDCPLKIDCAARRDLSLLNTRPLMRHVFSNPVLEASNDFLQNGNLVYDNKELLGKPDHWGGWHCPGLSELEFEGIIIREGWTLDTQKVALPLLANMFLVVVIAAKFLFGWSTAWTVGGFFVAGYIVMDVGKFYI